MIGMVLQDPNFFEYDITNSVKMRGGNYMNMQPEMIPDNMPPGISYNIVMPMIVLPMIEEKRMKAEEAKKKQLTEKYLDAGEMMKDIENILNEIPEIKNRSDSYKIAYKLVKGSLMDKEKPDETPVSVFITEKYNIPDFCVSIKKIYFDMFRELYSNIKYALRGFEITNKNLKISNDSVMVSREEFVELKKCKSEIDDMIENIQKLLPNFED